MPHSPGRAVALPLRAGWTTTLLPAGLPGVYLLLLGARPRYVGRSDTCLAGRLAAHRDRDDVTHVAWSVCAGPTQAFRAECYWYHRMAGAPGLLNRMHPAAPRGLHLGCPFCGDAARTAAEAVRELAAAGRSGRAVQAPRVDGLAGAA